MEEETPEPPNGEYVRKADGKVLKNNKIEIISIVNPEDFKPGDIVFIMHDEDWIWFTEGMMSIIQE